jgi:ankyrin repeat protein
MTAELFEAIARHDLDRLTTLLEGGADPDAIQPDKPRWRPLHAAIEELEDGGPIEALVQLLRHGAAVDAWDAGHDATPLLMSLFRGQAEATRLLLARGADPNVRGAEGDSPLRWSVEHDDLGTAALLLRSGAGATIDEPGGPAGANALGMAARRLKVPMIELLLAHGADPWALDADRFTARDRLPTRTAENSHAWDAASTLLGTRSR